MEFDTKDKVLSPLYWLIDYTKGPLEKFVVARVVGGQILRPNMHKKHDNCANKQSCYLLYLVHILLYVLIHKIDIEFDTYFLIKVAAFAKACFKREFLEFPILVISNSSTSLFTTTFTLSS